MGDKTHIEWTDATWNPTVGCTSVSPGCDHCYARALTERFTGVGSFDTMVLHPERLGLPLRWKRPRRIFVNSMSDLFHAAVPDLFIAKVFAVMAGAPQHTFQILTKRHGRMRSLLSDDGQHLLEATGPADESVADAIYGAPWPLPNVWLGVSVEDQKSAELRIPALLETSAAVHFLSCEPLLGPVVLRPEWLHSEMCFMRNLGPICACIPGDARIDWVITGGESGKDARPMRPQWARDIRDQCNSAGVPFLFKQWGEFAPARNAEAWQVGEEFWPIWRYGKKAAGRELDGGTWDEYPVGAH